MKYKVLLTASGVGSRLGDLTKFTNKSLVTIGNKPALSHIVEQYPKEIEIVVTLGYFGSHVKQFLEIAYPHRKFTFVEVKNYDGIGSSLGWSQLCAKEHLQCPFIYNACDTIVTQPIPPAGNYNWVAAKPGSGSSQYDSITVNTAGNISSFHRKGYIDSTHLHIGLIGVMDFSSYWKTMEDLYVSNPNDRSLNDVSVIEKMLVSGAEWRVTEFKEWFDIGNVTALKKAKDHWKDELSVLEKTKESISLVDGRVIKFFHNKEIVKKRVNRASILGDLTPTIIDSSENFYAYNFIVGKTAAKVMTTEKMADLIQWANQNLWQKQKSDKNFLEHCRYFYETKTKKRINSFLQKYPHEGKCAINGIMVPSISDLLKKIPWDFLCTKTPHQFHGDFILDNIVIENDGSFRLLDWRHEFGNAYTAAGDVYYDLAKMSTLR